MATGACNKCGEPKKLVLAERVCGLCRDELDVRWWETTATDWVLICPAEPNRLYEPSALTTVHIIRKMRQLEEEQGSSNRRPSGRMPPLHWLRFPSPEAELFSNDEAYSRYLFRNVTYHEMRGHWARNEVDCGLDIGGPDPDDVAMLRSMFPISGRRGNTSLMRPAKADEMAHGAGIKCDLHRREEVTRILRKWGFNEQGLSLEPDRPDTQPRAVRAWVEIRQRFGQIGLLDGSLFDYEGEIRTLFEWDERTVQTQHPLLAASETSISEVIARTFESWGFNHEGVPLNAIWDGDAEQRFQQAYAEIRERLRELGSLVGSAFEHEYDEWTAHPVGIGIHPAQKTRQLRGLSQVAGMAELKDQLNHEVIGPFKQPELYRRYRVSLPNGILFYGPPGCGKTYIARQLAEELGWSFRHCRPSDVASPYIHDTVSRIRALFSEAIEKAPSIIFIDEFEAFVPARSELGGHQQYKAEEVNEFLANLEGCADKRVLVIAATNEPEKIDLAVRRSGRFDKLTFIPPPDAEARRAMLEFHLKERPSEASLDLSGIAAVLEGYSASDIKLLVDEAARIALRRIEPIATETLLLALERVPPSIIGEDTRRYSEFRARGTQKPS
jgi:AAA+ superfamily predicted ATPase